MKIRKINNISLTVTDINIGDVIQIGEHFYLKIDKIPTELKNAFDKIREISQRQANNPNNAKILEQQKVPMSQMLFTNLFVFTKVIAESFPNLACHIDQARENFYHNNETANLSELFEKNLFQCAEFSVIAQLYLQSIGIDSEYVGGEFLGNKNWEFGDQHSYIIIHEKNIDYVFDPANNNTNAQPNISIIELSPEQKIKVQARLLSNKRKTAFFETRDIITNRKSFYGYGDGCNITEDMIFTKEEPTNINIQKPDLSRD